MKQDLFGWTHETKNNPCLRSFVYLQPSHDRLPMNQNNPETYALTARCPLDDAARLRALARARGLTPSALVAQLIHTAVADTISAPEDAAWADQRRTTNRRRRKLQDERTRCGLYRKPGWESLPRYTNSKTSRT